MSASVDSVVTVFSNLWSNHGSSLFNAILIVTTIGGQSVIRRLTFACPCAFPLNIYHSVVFIFGPSIALLIIGVMLNTTTWKLVHGCVWRVSETRHSWRTVIVSWSEVLVQSLIAPTAWLFVVFLDGGYFTCLNAAHYCTIDTAQLCQNETLMEMYRSSPHTFDSISGKGAYCPACICNLDVTDASYLASVSQIIAWGLLIFFGLSTLVLLCCVRMCDQYTRTQRNYVEVYRTEERNKFDEAAKAFAERVAEENAKLFFSQKEWNKRDWDYVSGVAEVNNPMLEKLHLMGGRRSQYANIYTPLQFWSEEKSRAAQKRAPVSPQNHEV